MVLTNIFSKVLHKIKDYGNLVMFSHTIFSLSFALISMLIAGNGHIAPETVFWILVAFMGARTGANAINRVIDAEIDKKNPRTATRQIPQGLVKKSEAIVLSIGCFILMVVAAAMLNPLCLMLSPVALFFLVFYSYTKRFTFLCHLFLGVTTAMAPVGAWIAVTGSISWIPLFMGAANTLWVAGFDIIYGSQDYEYDVNHGLHSIPVTFGVKNALRIAGIFHLGAMIFLVFVGLLTPALGWIYYIGLGIIAILFIIEHRMVKPEKLTHVNIASYSINQLISVTFLIFGVIDALI